VSKDVLDILKTMPRGGGPRGLKAEPEMVAKVHAALAYAASKDGEGLTRRNVWEALVEVGMTRSYKTFGDYCRNEEGELWARIRSR